PATWCSPLGGDEPTAPPLLFCPLEDHFWILDRDHPVGAAMAPRRGHSVAKPNGDHGKWRRVVGPRRLAVGDDDEQVDWPRLALDEVANAGADVGAAAAV